MIQSKIPLWKKKKKCDESNQDLGKNDPNAYRANALSRHFLRESMINKPLLLLRTQYQTAVLSKHNLVVWSTKTFFLSMETWSLHKPFLVCSGSPQAPILNYDRTRLRSHPLWTCGNLQVSWTWKQKIIVASPIIPERAGPAWLKVWAWRS